MFLLNLLWWLVPQALIALFGVCLSASALGRCPPSSGKTIANLNALYSMGSLWSRNKRH